MYLGLHWLRYRAILSNPDGGMLAMPEYQGLAEVEEGMKLKKKKYSCKNLRNGKCHIGTPVPCQPYTSDGRLCCFAKEKK